MTGRNDIERRMRTFLAEGTDRVADRVIDAALDLIDHTPQRRALRVPWRFSEMNNRMRLAATAIVVVVVVAAYAIYRPKAGDVGGSSPTPSPWGPLAVTDEDGRIVLEARGGAGPLGISLRCVTLLVEEANREMTLVWRSGQTSWDPTVRLIVFDDAIAGQIRLSDGDRIEIGGAGIAEPGAPDQGAPQPTWLSAPDSSCPDELWAVHAVRRIGPQLAP